jgi:AcrR family transcriptional regulator
MKPRAPHGIVRSVGGPSDQPDKRLTILLAAEKLFALHGFHGVSIRDIATEAGVPLALVGYYFGAKHELYHAIFESWHPMIQQRLSSLAAVIADGDEAGRLERILDAFIGPVLALHRHADGRYYALMAARDLRRPVHLPRERRRVRPARPSRRRSVLHAREHLLSRSSPSSPACKRATCPMARAGRWRRSACRPTTARTSMRPTTSTRR